MAIETHLCVNIYERIYLGLAYKIVIFN